MKLRYVFAIFLLLAGGVTAYFINNYWIHRFDVLIERHAKVYRLDPQLVWSLIYQETYFKPSKIGAAGEVGLMQVTPTVAREWAAQTGMSALTAQMERDPQTALSDPERNIQIGCWYLEKLFTQFRDVPGVEARMLAGYNAGASRVVEWNKSDSAQPLTEEQFIQRIDISTTRAYVNEILTRYRARRGQPFYTQNN